jgi:tripartite-type tricarboxylate transporter receptor subunit TctC
MYSQMPLRHTHRRRILAASACAWLTPLATAWAQTAPWPAGPLKIVLPLPPGGGPDALVRRLAELLKQRFKQPVIVENKPGASGMLGLKAVVQAPADGLTMAYLISSHVTTDLLSPTVDLLKEFEPVTMDGSAPYLLLVKAGSPYHTLADLVAAARKTPGRLSYGSGGNGSSYHMCLAQFFGEAQLQLLHVPYKGGLASTTALAGGEIDVSVAVPASARALLGSGHVRALAVTAGARLPLFAEVPTVQEAIGLPFQCLAWSGYAVRKGTPPAMVATLHKAMVEAIQSPEYQKLVADAAATTSPSATPESFGEVIRRQYAIEGALIKRLGIKAE